MAYHFPIKVGDRVALAPHLDLWMQGQRYGTVEDIEVIDGTTFYTLRLSPVVCVLVKGEDLLGAVRT